MDIREWSSHGHRGNGVVMDIEERSSHGHRGNRVVVDIGATE